MIKLICHFKRKPGLSRQEFRDYYENNHVPLIQKMLPLMADYRRSYMKPDGVFSPSHISNPAPMPDFDVVTEVWYRNRAEYDAMLNVDPEIYRLIAEDEAKFMDRDSMVLFLVDEERTSPEKISAARVAAGAEPL